MSPRTLRCRPLLALAILPGFLSACSPASDHPADAAPSAPRPGASAFHHDAVAADHPIASRAGAAMFDLGGNAVDAAVATSFTLSVVRPYSCGIGGGGFMVIFLPPDATHPQRSIALNYREMTPSAIDPLFFERQSDPQASTRGANAVAIPGTVAGLLYALEHFGTLDRHQVLQPAIAAATEGFIVDDHYAAAANELIEKFRKRPDWKRRFAFVWDRFLKKGAIHAGDRIRLPEQAEALRLIADQGASAFYTGPIAHAIAEAIRADTGVLSLTDLTTFKVDETTPLQFDAFGSTFLTMPPPSSGGLALAQTLVMLDLSKFAPPVGPTPLTPASAHREIEALKHAFADRAEWLADPAFEPVPLNRLLSTPYLRERASTFNADHTLSPADYGSRRSTEPSTPTRDNGTSHFSVVDRHGAAVACTETINLEFGSLVAVDRYGFCLNNEMDDFLTRRGAPNAFKLTQSERNLPAPGKRPLSSMTPTIVLDHAGHVQAIAGASGGPRIITATTQTLINTLVRGMNAADAVAAPRLHHQWMPDEVQLERDFSETPAGRDLAAGLRERRHTVTVRDHIGEVQLIRWNNVLVGWDAACDPRKGGAPTGH